MNKIEEIAGKITAVMFSGEYTVDINTNKGFQIKLILHWDLCTNEKQCWVMLAKQESSDYCYIPTVFEGESGKWSKHGHVVSKSPKETNVMNTAKSLNKHLNSLSLPEIQELKNYLKQGNVTSFMGNITVINK